MSVTIESSRFFRIKRHPWYYAAVFAATLAGSACASAGTPRPFPVPDARAKAPATFPTAAPPAADAVIATALALRGVPYRNGGADPSGFDCSGFTQYVYGRHGVALPRAVRDQFRSGDKVDGDELEAGDLLFFVTEARQASHVGIAIGGDQFVHAPSSTGAVRVERFTSGYWSRRFVGARRVR
jgi:cell wall-associated NlpC family hydrolase